MSDIKSIVENMETTKDGFPTPSLAALIPQVIDRLNDSGDELIRIADGMGWPAFGQDEYAEGMNNKITADELEEAWNTRAKEPKR